MKRGQLSCSLFVFLGGRRVRNVWMEKEPRRIFLSGFVVFLSIVISEKRSSAEKIRRHQGLAIRIS